MELNYNILLFEDDSDYVTSIEDLLKDYLDDLGFKLKLSVEVDGNNINELILDDEWNLILMDYNLSSSDNGDELIQQIRGHELYTEIIFYSEDDDFEDKIKSELIEGIYFARGRGVLIEKVKKVIDVTLKKNHDINNMRGLVIAETIDLETKMDNLILSYFGSDDEKRDVFEKILEPKFGALTIKKKFDLINKMCKVRLKILNGDGEDVSGLTSCHSEFKKIENEIIEIRNILSHTNESTEYKNKLISKMNKKNTLIYVDFGWCIKKRKDIIRHSLNLEDLQAHFN